MMIILAILLIVIVITIIIVIMCVSTNKVYIPNWEIKTSSVQDQLSGPTIYEVFLPIKDIPDDITLETAPDLLLVPYQRVIDLLQNYGTILYTSPSKTYLLFLTSVQQLQELFGNTIYLINDLLLGTANQPAYISIDGHPLIFNYFNFWNDAKEKKTLSEWTEKYNIINQPLGAPTGKVFSVISEGNLIKSSLGSNQGNSIGILASDFPDRLALQTLAINLGYPPDKFINQIKKINLSLSAPYYTVSEPIFVDSQGTEASADLQIIFSVTPDVTVYMFYQFIPDYVANIELFPLWIGYEYLSVNIWSSSITPNGFYNYNKDYKRKSQEYQLLSTLGVNTFQGSGDQGVYSSQLYNSVKGLDEVFDLHTPDNIIGGFDSCYTVKVGGFVRGLSPSQNNSTFNHIFSMAVLYVDPNNQKPDDIPYLADFLASGGGFSRGYYTDPDWKWKNTLKYRQTYLNSLKDNMGPNGKIVSSLPIEVDPNGDSSPDIIGISSIIIYVGDKPVDSVGTSIAGPYMASIFNIINALRGEPIKLLIKELHLHPELMNRSIEGRNNLFNLYGFASDNSLPWDPVQGLGMPDFTKLKKYFVG